MIRCLAKLVKAFAKGRQQEELLAIAEDLWVTDLFDPMICASKYARAELIKAVVKKEATRKLSPDLKQKSDF